MPEETWGRHFRNIVSLEQTLTNIESVDINAPNAWAALSEIEIQLRQLFQSNMVHGLLSHSVLRVVKSVSREIRQKCKAVRRELEEFVNEVRKGSQSNADLVYAVKQLEDIQSQLDSDIGTLNDFEQRTDSVCNSFEKFLTLYASIAWQSRYRPTLQQLHRLRLNEKQEYYVALNHEGSYRIQGASGSGKTIILIHRALRLALENPTCVIRLMTINRSLAVLLRESIEAINGIVPPNLYVAAFYDFLLDCLGLFEKTSEFRLVDDRSGEHISVSWKEFCDHPSKNVDVNVFAEPGVKSLVEKIAGRESLAVDAHRYLGDEMVYIQSGYTKSDREQYLADPRTERSIALGRIQRTSCLQVLNEWEHHLAWGNLCNIDGLTLRVAHLLDEPDNVDRVKAKFCFDFVLLDEVQDFSTLELRIVHKLVTNLEGENRFFFVGDLNQKVFPKQHNTKRAGFTFTGRAAILKQNYRNTKQILQAAYCIPTVFPPNSAEAVEIANPDLSQYEGGRPVALKCTTESQIQRVMEIVQRRKDCRVGVVSENDGLLVKVREAATRLGFEYYDVYTLEEFHRWKQQKQAGLVVGRMEAVKGFEFDTVIACDISEGTLPRPGTPQDEYWREAAVLYSALTRARDELILTYVDMPSLFLKVMSNDVDFHEVPNEDILRGIVERLRLVGAQRSKALLTPPSKIPNAIQIPSDEELNKMVKHQLHALARSISGFYIPLNPSANQLRTGLAKYREGNIKYIFQTER